MANSAIHPITVHIPLALPVFLPAIVAYAWWCTKHSSTRKHWNLTLITYSVLLVSSCAAYWTGGLEAFSSPASADALLTHRDAALYFLAAGTFGLSLSATLRWNRKIPPNPLALILVLQSLTQLALAIWVGHMGGELVFR